MKKIYNLWIFICWIEVLKKECYHLNHIRQTNIKGLLYHICITTEFNNLFIRSNILIRFVKKKKPNADPLTFSLTLTLLSRSFFRRNFMRNEVLHTSKVWSCCKKKTSQDAGNGRYGVAFFGPHYIWLSKYLLSEVFIQWSAHSVKYSFSEVLIQWSTHSVKY